MACSKAVLLLGTFFFHVVALDLSCIVQTCLLLGYRLCTEEKSRGTNIGIVSVSRQWQ